MLSPQLLKRLSYALFSVFDFVVLFVSNIFDPIILINSAVMGVRDAYLDPGHVSYISPQTAVEYN
jgi:hypothetical protein